VIVFYSAAAPNFAQLSGAQLSGGQLSGGQLFGVELAMAAAHVKEPLQFPNTWLGLTV
jgi:hypothetical protein